MGFPDPGKQFKQELIKMSPFVKGREKKWHVREKNDNNTEFSS